MRTHQPPGYDCPFCALAAGRETALNERTDVVYRDGTTTAFVSPKWWDAAPGHVLVIPNEHFENVYVIPEGLLAAVYKTGKLIATAMTCAYGCKGTSMRQHNEPGGGQDVWHFHVHVFPRNPDDGLYESNAATRVTTPDERAPIATQLRAALLHHGGGRRLHRYLTQQGATFSREVWPTGRRESVRDLEGVAPVRPSCA
jgi:histidine triad (HIT) family protein